MKYGSMSRKCNKALDALDQAKFELQGDLMILLNEVRNLAHLVMSKDKEFLTREEEAAVYWAINEVKQLRELFFDRFSITKKES